MTLEFRRASDTDLITLCALDTVVANAPQRAIDIARWVRHGNCHIAVRDGVTVGYGVLEKSFFGRDFIELLMVDKAARREGIGRALLRYLIAQCREESVWTSTNTSNDAMQALVTSEGFIESGIVHGLDPDDPELIFRKPIRTSSPAT
jgi:ribosomal protein S18 acetylase RimI-like enzyme